MKKGIDYTGITITYFCHNGTGKYLFNKRSKSCRDEHGRWDCGGGGLDFGDSPEDTLQKEIQEEYCADIIESEFLGYRDVHRENGSGDKIHWLALDFRVLVDPKQVQNGEPHKFDEIGWFTLESLPSSLHSAVPHQIELYRERLI